MSALFDSGRVVDLILALMALEAVALAVLLGWRGVRLAGVLVNLAAGAGMLLALRGALVGAGWPWIALALAGSLLAHVVELALRARG